LAEKTSETNPIQLQQQIILAVQTHRALPLNELLYLIGQDGASTTQLIRTMIEKELLYLNEEGNISILPA
jgi:DNA-binding IclR family transcriptional regulator